MRISRVPPQDNHVFPRRTRLPTYVPRRMQQRINVAKNCNLPAKHGRLLIFLSGWYPDATYRLPLLKSVHTDEMLELLGPALRACSAGGGIFIITGSIIVHVADPFQKCISLWQRYPLDNGECVLIAKWAFEFCKIDHMRCPLSSSGALKGTIIGPVSYPA